MKVFNYWKKQSTTRKIAAGIFLVVLLLFWFALPNPLFKDPTSIVIEDNQGNLLGARIAKDGQWRFPMADSLPEKYVKALLTFEDKRFYYHPGVDPISLVRAVGQNLRAGRVVSGGSTISMQVIRLSRRNKPRTVWEKLIELFLATRLDMGYTKQEILRLYASHAPFGGNVVGIEAASWRYFGKRPRLLTWAEAATLAVLPNSPALIHPGRNRAQLREKRDRLLDRMRKAGIIDSLSCELAKEESLPQKPLPLPQLAPHLLDRAQQEYFSQQKNPKTRLTTTIDRRLQAKATDVLEKHLTHLKGNEIHNAAAIIIEVETGNVLAYVGNVIGTGAEHGEQVDIIAAPRSTGSILKPILFAHLLYDGLLLPESLVADVPTSMSGYRPENYNQNYDGVIPLKRALVRSLNVPFVRLLQDYGLEKFHRDLEKLGMTTLFFPPSHYGLPLILGGAEGNLFDITNMYACMARSLGHFYDYSGRYDPGDYRSPNYDRSFTIPRSSIGAQVTEPYLLDAGSIWHTFEAMRQLERPNSEGEWEYFQSGHPIAWKTGTSYGFRDAWAVGVTPEYAIGVWTGNADGEGRPGLVGIYTSAPILFDLFDLVPGTAWFDPPFDDLVKLEVCSKSGYRATSLCERDTLWMPTSGINVDACPYHRLVHIDSMMQYQLNTDCASLDQMVHKPWFVLPPVEEYFYRFRDPGYRPLPPLHPDCRQKGNEEGASPLQLIYPKDKTTIYIPIDLDGKESRTVFKAAHRRPETKVFWYIDKEYLGNTEHFHQMELNPPEGEHLLTLVDAEGNRVQQYFEIIPRAQ